MADSNFFKNQGPLSLKEIAEISGAVLYIPENSLYTQESLIDDLSPIDEATKGTITVLNNSKYIDKLSQSFASACFLEEKYAKKAPKNMVLFFSVNPYKSYALTASKFYPINLKSSFVSHDNFIIGKKSKIGKNVIIEPSCVIGENVEIGENTYIGPLCYIADGVKIGKNCQIRASATISHAIIGDNVIIYPGSRIGQEGFGFASDSEGHYKVPQLGRVIIGSNVEIGSNTCIDRGSSSDTLISDGCMIDNLVQIGHNVKIGKNCIIVSQVGISGSTKIGEHVILGGQAGVAGHLNIEKGAQVAAKSGVIKDIKPFEIQGGYPAVPIKQWHRQTIAFKKLVNRRLEESE